jgi:hypothetical protein
MRQDLAIGIIKNKETYSSVLSLRSHVSMVDSGIVDFESGLWRLVHKISADRNRSTQFHAFRFPRSFREIRFEGPHNSISYRANSWSLASRNLEIS